MSDNSHYFQKDTLIRGTQNENHHQKPDTKKLTGLEIVFVLCMLFIRNVLMMRLQQNNYSSESQNYDRHKDFETLDKYYPIPS